MLIGKLLIMANISQFQDKFMLDFALAFVALMLIFIGIISWTMRDEYINCMGVICLAVGICILIMLGWVYLN